MDLYLGMDRVSQGLDAVHNKVITILVYAYMMRHVNFFMKFAFSWRGLVAFGLQELPYLFWMIWPPANDPLRGNEPATPLLKILEAGGGILTVALLLLLVPKTKDKPSNPVFLWFAGLLLLSYYVSWGFYLAGKASGLLIVFGLTVQVPLYYFFVSLYLQNGWAASASLFFLIGHTWSNVVNFLY